MGGAVSHGLDNNDLISNLCEADYIKSPKVEFAMRAVDRGLYFAEGRESAAYWDLAYKNGDNHLSAPSIYCEVLEALDFKEGLSFLNIGSGTGYLSTVAGLLIGANGTNHGVEICENVVHFSRSKLQEFLRNVMPDVYGFEFCEPIFVAGDGLCMNTHYRQYDRVYCGAAVDSQYEEHMKSLIKVDGLLVMPCNNTLQKIHRVSETDFECSSLLPVSFASMVESCKKEDLELNNTCLIEIASNPLQLQAICRVVIRRQLGPKLLKNLTKLKLPLPPPITQFLLYS